MLGERVRARVEDAEKVTLDLHRLDASGASIRLPENRRLPAISCRPRAKDPMVRGSGEETNPLAWVRVLVAARACHRFRKRVFRALKLVLVMRLPLYALLAFCGC